MPQAERALRTRRPTSRSSQPRLRGPNAMSSKTVSAKSWRSGSWETYPMRLRSARRSSSRAVSMPSTDTVPAAGTFRAQASSMVVDLPDPVWPMSATAHPGSMRKFACARARGPRSVVRPRSGWKRESRLRARLRGDRALAYENETSSNSMAPCAAVTGFGRAPPASSRISAHVAGVETASGRPLPPTEPFGVRAGLGCRGERGRMVAESERASSRGSVVGATSTPASRSCWEISR